MPDFAGPQNLLLGECWYSHRPGRILAASSLYPPKLAEPAFTARVEMAPTGVRWFQGPQSLPAIELCFL